MDVMQLRAVPGSSLQLLGDVTDLDDHQVKVEFPHERVDSFKTTFGTRAFEDSFKEQLPIMVWAHDLRDPIGRGIRAQVLPKHNEVIGRFSDLEAVPSAKRAYHQIHDGTITDFSFGYVNGPEIPHPDPTLRRRGVRQIPRATMREFSPVAIGSIPGAKVAGIREDGNLVTVDSPESVARLVELNVISPDEGKQLLRSFGLLDGTRAPADMGGPWSVADAVAHLQEAHGLDVYRAGLTTMTPETLAIIHSQVGSGFHDHGPFTGWLNGIAASLAAALSQGTMLQTPVDQQAANAVAAASGYPVQSGVGGLPPFGRQGDASAAVGPGAAQMAGAAGYQARPGIGTMIDGRASADQLHRRQDGDCAMYAKMAQDAAAEAVSAAGAGDSAKASMKAKHARMHARMARESGDRGDTSDAQSILAAEAAAMRASDAADQAEPAGAGAWQDGAEPVRADHVMSLIERHDPAMAMRLRDGGQLALAPSDMEILFRSSDGSIMDGSGDPVAADGGPAVMPEAAELALNVEAALDQARQWLDGADVGALPEEVQQALALVGAAADGSDALVDVLGAAGSRAADDGDDEFSDTPWEKFDESDYTPAQWKDAALIDTGDGGEDTKGRYALPVKEPSGKVNRHGITAAASRIGSVKAPADEKQKAARQLMSYYGKMKKPTPPAVLKVLGHGERASEEELKAAEALLDSRLSRVAPKTIK